MSKQRILLLLAIFGILFMHTVSAATCSDIISDGESLSNLTGAFAGAISMSLLALIVSMMVIAIGYTLSKIIPSLSGYQGWLNGEYKELAKSMLLVGSIIFILSFLGSISLALFGPAYVSLLNNPVPSGSYATTFSGLYQASCKFIENTYGSFDSNLILNPAAATNIDSAIVNIATINFEIRFLEGIQFGAYLPIPFIIAAYTSGFQAPIYSAQVLDHMINTVQNVMLLPIAFILRAQDFLLPDVVLLALSVLIPMGLIFRALPLTRPIGGTLIAFGIGIGIFYPVTLLALNYPVTTFVNGVLGANPLGGGSAFSGLFGAIFSGIISGIGIVGTMINTAISTLFGSSINVINFIVADFLFGLTQMMLFLLDLAILFPATDAVAKALGGSIKLSLSGKLKLM